VGSVTGNLGIHLPAPGVDAPLEIPDVAIPLLLDQPAAEVPAADAGMAEHHHRLLPVEPALKIRQPLPVAAQGQMQDVERQPGQGQFSVLAHVHDLERLPGFTAPLKVHGRERAGDPRAGRLVHGGRRRGGGVRMAPSC